jgi:hypothetical protein
MEMKDADITPWADLITFDPPPSSSRFEIQRIPDASGRITLDFYPVLIGKLPSSFENGEAFLEYFRLHINDFAGDLASFSPYEKSDRSKWKSPDPIGAIVHIDMGVGWGNIEDGAVAVTSKSPRAWVFTTVDTPWGDWGHPVSGHREFGISKQRRGYLFYTRGADRPTSKLDQLLDRQVFFRADELWRKVTEQVAKRITDLGGSATVPEPISLHLAWGSVERQLRDVHGVGGLIEANGRTIETRRERDRVEKSQRMVDQSLREQERLMGRMRSDMDRLQEQLNRQQLDRQREEMQRNMDRMTREMSQMRERQQALERTNRSTREMATRLEDQNRQSEHWRLEESNRASSRWRQGTVIGLPNEMTVHWTPPR